MTVLSLQWLSVDVKDLTAQIEGHATIRPFDNPSIALSNLISTFVLRVAPTNGILNLKMMNVRAVMYIQRHFCLSNYKVWIVNELYYTAWIAHYTAWIAHYRAWITHYRAWIAHYTAWIAHYTAWIAHYRAWIAHYTAWIAHYTAWIVHYRVGSNSFSNELYYTVKTQKERDL